jgi:hypothetical protein
MRDHVANIDASACPRYGSIARGTPCSCRPLPPHAAAPTVRCPEQTARPSHQLRSGCTRLSCFRPIDSKHAVPSTPCRGKDPYEVSSQICRSGGRDARSRRQHRCFCMLQRRFDSPRYAVLMSTTAPAAAPTVRCLEQTARPSHPLRSGCTRLSCFRPQTASMLCRRRSAGSPLFCHASSR